jgi:hypothetical protein
MKGLKRLAADGIYGDPISGYTDHGQTLKEQFLRDARALLKQTGQILARSGFTECSVRVNPAGAAVSGDVHADFWRPDDLYNTVYCTIGASVVLFGGRRDGLTIMARKEKRADQPGRGRTAYRTLFMGINQWIDPGMHSGELAAELLKIADLAEAWPGVLPGCTYRSRTAGCLEVPSAAIRSREEALQWKSALGAALEASRQDAGRVPQESAEPDSEPPVRQMPLFEPGNETEAGGEVCTA